MRIPDFVLWYRKAGQQGFSLIAAVFIIVILAFMGVMLVSVLGSSTSTSVNEMQSVRALYIAEGGLEHALMNGAYCAYNAPATTLGTGSFAVTSQFVGPAGLAAANVQDNPLTVAAASITVSNPPGTANYIIPGTVQIDSENISCTGTAGNQFTGCIRGWAGSNAGAHNRGALITQCTVTSTGTVATGFLTGNVSRTVRATVGP